MKSHKVLCRNEDGMNEKIVLIDGHSIAYRAFYGVPDLSNSEGLHTNAIYGFLNIMFKILEEEKPEYFAVVFDKEKPTFRHEIFDAYKGTRKPMPMELREQIPVLQQLLKAMQIKVLGLEGYEADDILGTIAKESEENGLLISLVSGDRDLLQIASDKIKIRIPKTKRGGTEIEDYNKDDVLEKYGVEPIQIIDLKGLMGDTADNIPGVPGIGEKRATDIIKNFASVENAYAHIEEVKPKKAQENLKEHYEQALLSKKLATICTNVPLEYEQEDLKINDFYTKEAFEIIKKLEFKSILTRFSSSISQDNHLEESFQVITKKVDLKQKINEIGEKKEQIGLFILKLPIDNKSKFEMEETGQYSLFAQLQLSEPSNEIKGILGIAVSSEQSTWCALKNEEIKEDDLLEQIEQLAKFSFSNISSIETTMLEKETIQIGMLGLKDQLDIFPANEQSNIMDLSIASYLLNPLKDTYTMEDIARDYIGISVPSYQQLFGKKSLKEVFIGQKKELAIYSCYEAYVALKGIAPLLEKLKQENMLSLFLEIEMPLVYTLYDMEYRGIMVNRQALKEYGEKLQKQIVILEKNIYDLAGETFNINSPKQLGVILFEKLKLPFAKKTKTGYSTSADILEKLRCEDPIVGMILEYRQLTKLKSTYADGLANYISDVDQRIHGKFNQTITATGRISSTEPNLQNIPIRMEIGREIRKVFIPKEDYVFLDADYSQIELRVLAAMSEDETLINAYKEEQDIHRITASQVFHTPLEEVTSLQRSNAKAVNFGIVYGISSFGLGQDLNITKKEAEEYIKKYFETYPRVKQFLEELVENGKKNGFVETLYHRKRPVPELSSSNFVQRSFGERIAMNSPIQGTAADIIKIAMLKVNQELKKRNLKSQLLLQVHDELLVETHKDEIEEVWDILQKEMYHVANLTVPLEIEINHGKNWYEAKEDKKMEVIGITGGVGVGKSLVVKLAEEIPFVKAIKADEVGHLAMEVGQTSYEKIVDLFGMEILNEDKTINRKKVAEIVFADNDKLEALNSIIHPFVREYIENAVRKAKIEGKYDYFIIEAAILLETGYQEICDEIWVVTAKEDIRRQRLKETRGYSDEKITAIMNEQMAEQEFLSHADAVIENNEDIEQVKRKLNLLLM